MASDAIVIGIDAAVSPAKRGVVVGRVAGGTSSIEEVLPPTPRTIGQRIKELHVSARILICVDAPLGWPLQLAESLIEHSAGAPLAVEPNRLFRRETDRWIKRNINQQPLDVGADRIARTACSALVFLQELSDLLEASIPLAWAPDFAGAACIEVYPAASLAAHGLSSKGYKGNSDVAITRRTGLLDALPLNLSSPVLQSALAVDHVFDAVICAATGFDFLSGACAAPPDMALARREGWIWVKHP